MQIQGINFSYRHTEVIIRMTKIIYGVKNAIEHCKQLWQLRYSIDEVEGV